MKRSILLAAAAGALAAASFAYAQSTPSLRDIHKVYIEKMPNDLDQYLRAEISKQFKGSLIVVLDKNDAVGILTGVDEEKKGTGAEITGRCLGLHDNATGTVSLVDKSGKTILWTDEAGDRSLLFGAMKRGGERKVADRLISKLRRPWAGSRRRALRLPAPASGESVPPHFRAAPARRSRRPLPCSSYPARECRPAGYRPAAETCRCRRARSSCNSPPAAAAGM